MRIFLSSLLIAFFILPNANAQRKNDVSIKKIGVFNPRQLTEEWSVQIQNLESPSPDGDSYRAELQRRKLALEKKYPRNNYVTPKNRLNSTPPITGIMFEGNIAGNSTPNDNTMAISNDGIIVSSINSNVYFYDVPNDSLLGSINLHQFAIANGFNASYSKYDPKALYDPEADRFILTFLNGNTPLSSRILVAFSTSNNPMDSWNIYAIPGNPKNNNRWSDYPAIEINENDFFCTINLIIPGQPWQTGFDGTLIWNCDKTSGYNGDSILPMIFWDSLYYDNKLIRNLHPIRNARGEYNQEQYFVSNRNFSPECDSIFLLKITGSMMDNAQNLTINHLTTAQPYYVSVDARQPSGHLLATNDSRVLGGSLEGNYIQFVQNSTNTLTGNCAIYHGIINLTTNNCTGFHIASDTLDFGYPNMASTAIFPGEQETMISFEYSSANHAPGFGAVYFDGANYSDFTVLKTGQTFINVLSDNLERWGDYSAAQRKYNEPCRVWASGTFGKSGNDNGTWIAEISASDTCRINFSSVASNENLMQSLVFPNPNSGQFTFDFTLEKSETVMIEILNILGQPIKILYEDGLFAGKNRLSFSTQYLESGNYILQLRSKNKILLVEKIQVIKN